MQSSFQIENLNNQILKLKRDLENANYDRKIFENKINILNKENT